MSKFIIAIVAVIILGGGYYWYVQSSGSSMQDVSTGDTNNIDSTTPATNNATNIPPNTNTGTSVNVNVGAGVTTPSTKTFTVTGSNFSFTPSSMTVKKGDTVRIIFKNTSGTHDLNVEGYNVHTKIIQGGEEETITFVADKAGSFEYYCSVSTHRAMGMKGTLTVQ